MKLSWSSSFHHKLSILETCMREEYDETSKGFFTKILLYIHCSFCYSNVTNVEISLLKYLVHFSSGFFLSQCSWWSCIQRLTPSSSSSSVQYWLNGAINCAIIQLCSWTWQQTPNTNWRLNPVQQVYLQHKVHVQFRWGSQRCAGSCRAVCDSNQACRRDKQSCTWQDDGRQFPWGTGGKTPD